MHTSDSSAPVVVKSGLYLWLGIELLAGGLAGHVFAARAIGGSAMAYRDHLLGFALLTVLSVPIFAGLGAKFWRGRHDLTVLYVGITQALLGIYVYIERFRVHG